MQRLTYQDICHPKFVTDTINRDRVCQYKVQVELSDGTLGPVHIRHLIYNVMFWKVLIHFNVPIRKEHYREEVVISKKTITAFRTALYHELIELFPDKQFDITWQLWLQINRLHKFAKRECCEYHSGFDIMDAIELMESEEIAETIKFDPPINLGIPVVEKMLKEKSAELNNKLLKPFKGNTLYEYCAPGLINKQQIPQIFISFGTRTDIDDSMIPYHVQGSAIDGLRDTRDYCIESLSCKKSNFYNHGSISGSQYFNRKTQLLSSMVMNIYDLDCGSTVYVDLPVTKQNHMNLIGKAIKFEGNILYLTEKNISHFVGKTIAMRSPITCQHSADGFCKVCGGMMTNYFPPVANIGMMTSTDVVSPMSQQILSSKHLIATNAIVYTLTQPQMQWWRQQGHELFVRSDIAYMFDNLMLGVLQTDIPLHDISILDNENAEEARFSNITRLMLRDPSGAVVVDMDMRQGDLTPFFSMDMLKHIESRMTKLDIDEKMVWIPLRKFDHDNPIFKTTIVNDSTVAFMNAIVAFLGREDVSTNAGIKQYTNVSHALTDLSNRIYSKVSTNIIHIEVLLKAFLTTSDLDYTIPIIKNVDGVSFRATNDVITNRSLSGELAFEELSAYVANPKSYILGRNRGPLDRFFGI